MDTLSAATFIDRALNIPYLDGGDTWAAADCWGIVELYYRHVLGVELSDRGNISPGCYGLQEGFDRAEHWKPIDKPENHCLVIFRAKGLEAGHVGVYFEGSVVHSSDTKECVVQPLHNRLLRSRVTALLRYV